MVPSYSGTPCLVAPLTGFLQSLVPLARPIKFATPTGALSGKSVQVILPTVVSMMATGFAAADVVAGLAAPLGLVGAVCAHPGNLVIRINTKIANELRMNFPQ